MAPASDLRPLLTALQLGDSFFPSGAASHSWGLEGLWTDGMLITAVAGRGQTAAVSRASPPERAIMCDALGALLAAQIDGRWAGTDRVATVAAHGAAHEAEGDLDDVVRIDEFVECSTPVAAWRAAGRRCGQALLAAHGALGTPGAAVYAARVERGEAPGHACVVQGVVAAGCGLDAGEAAALAGYGVVVAIVSAALRMGLVGHRDGQRLLAGQRERIARWAETPAPPIEEMNAWVPAAEIAAMRHEARRGRLFAS